MSRVGVLAAIAVTLALVAAGAGALSAQSRPPRPYPRPAARPPAPEGRQIETADGDTVIVDGDDRVHVVRRHQAEGRVVADAGRQSLLVIADWGTVDRPGPDGAVDRVWKFEGVQGDWPLEPRWQGALIVLEPEPVRSSTGLRADALVLETPAGRVAFRGGPPRAEPGDTGLVLGFRGMAAGGREGATFDQAEREAASPDASWNTRTMDLGHAANGAAWTSSSVGSGGIGFTNEVVTGGTTAGLDGTGLVMPLPVPGTDPRRAARPFPRPVHRVQPQWPDPATLPGVRGMVTVRVVVGADGLVRDAAVLRGLPGLDDAALSAARQWRFESNGVDDQPFAISWPFPQTRR